MTGRPILSSLDPTSIEPSNQVVIAGVAGSGKTTLGQELATALGWDFVDADVLHSPENVEKMARGEPLTDADREPWLVAIGDRLEVARRRQENAVLACSALKRNYRKLLLSRCQTIRFVQLLVPQPTIAGRLAERTYHFMPLCLMESQFTALDLLDQSEPGFSISATAPITTLVDEVIAKLATLLTNQVTNGES